MADVHKEGTLLEKHNVMLAGDALGKGIAVINPPNSTPLSRALGITPAWSLQIVSG